MARDSSSLLLMLLLVVIIAEASAESRRVFGKCKICPPGYTCQLKRYCRFGGPRCWHAPTCLPQGTTSPPVPTAPPSPAPPSCQMKSCGQGKVCVLQEVICVTHPCHPIPVCVPNLCATAKCGDNKVCVTVRRNDSVPACSDFPSCQFTVKCTPVVKPKPGFCPTSKMVAQISGAASCRYDQECPSNLLCCPHFGGRNGGRCVAPAYPNPCTTITCPPAPDIIGGTCAVRGGRATCLDRVCQPGSFFCRQEKQCYCSDAAEIVCTDEAAPSGCPF